MKESDSASHIGLYWHDELLVSSAFRMTFFLGCRPKYLINIFFCKEGVGKWTVHAKMIIHVKLRTT